MRAALEDLIVVLVLLVLFAALAIARRPALRAPSPSPSRALRGSSRVLVVFMASLGCSDADRWSELRRAIRSVYGVHDEAQRALVLDWIVINEHSPERDQSAWKTTVERHFPWITFVQRDERNRGQARGLNLIIDDVLPAYAARAPELLWLHWEESWYARKPFLADVCDVMESSNVDHLAVHEDALPDGDKDPRRTPRGTRYEVVVPTAYYYRALASEARFPSFSLRPGVMRFSFLRRERTLRFDESPRRWPVAFEYMFGREMMRRGGRAGVLTSQPATRDPSHRSTYSSERLEAAWETLRQGH
jgi:hypothetical protein